MSSTSQLSKTLSKTRSGKTPGAMAKNFSKLGQKGKEAMCPICEEEIGDEAIQCDGPCNAWLHRRCAGLSKPAFVAASQPSIVFNCPLCRLSMNECEIKALKESVEMLVKRLECVEANLKSTSNPCSGQPDYASVLNQGLDVSNTTKVVQPSLKAEGGHGDANPPSAAQLGKSINTVDRKFNIVLFGVDESSAGNKSFDRHKDEFEKITSILASVDETIGHLAIKDFFRLGKYSVTLSRPRPILVKFVRCHDAISILANAKSLRKPYFVKPDLTPEQRRREKVLLEARWSLIQSGFERASIKIRKSSIYLNNVLHGSLDSNNVFQREVAEGAAHQSESAYSHEDVSLRNDLSPIVSERVVDSSAIPSVPNDASLEVAGES